MLNQNHDVNTSWFRACSLINFFFFFCFFYFPENVIVITVNVVVGRSWKSNVQTDRFQGTSNSSIIAGFQRAQSTYVVLQLDTTVGQLHLSPGHSAIRFPSVSNNVMRGTSCVLNLCDHFPGFPPSAVHKGGTTGTDVESHRTLTEFVIDTQK